MSSVESGYLDPNNFDESWNHPDPIERKGWREAITKEFTDTEDRNVWKLIPQDDKPPDRKVIGSKWVFRRKKNGVYRARLVALGYNQIPGVDFTDNFSPVANDVTIKLMLALLFSMNWISVMLDIETAFLEGRLDSEIYMEVPDGYEYFKDGLLGMILLILGSMYGLVQASRIWYKLLTSVLTGVA